MREYYIFIIQAAISPPFAACARDMPASGTRSGPSQQSPSPASQPPAAGEFTRLHITPFDADLLNVVIPASIRPKAQNVSFHSVATFPENRYGFVDLPKIDADKLKAKLNGSILKGTKMRIENAIPEVREEPSGREGKEKEKSRKSKSKEEKSSKKRKRGDEVEEGVLLSDRKVKRGWTEVPDHKIKKDRKKDKSAKGDKDKNSKRIKSKYTEQEECLLKVTLPSGATKSAPGDDDATARKKRKKKGKEREITVHEFENTTRFPSFLKGAGSGESSRPDAAEFVEGKGWVDEHGNVVESVASKRRSSTTSKKAVVKKAAVAEETDDTSSSGTSSEEEDEESERDESPAKKKPAPVAESDTSSLGSEDEDEFERSVEQSTPSAAKTKRARPDSSGSSKNLTIKIPPPNTPSPSRKEVHPLEALYKRKKPEEGAVETPAQAPAFTFFGGDAEDEDEEGGSNRNSQPPVPMTPFTRQDFEWRSTRSAAPTPDTAHPSRMQSLWSMEEDDEDEDMDDAAKSVEGEDRDNEDEDEADNDEMNGTSDGKQPSSSDFQSWFWENRRDLNQSWMKRRKAAAKEKRHRENKARASKAV